MSDYFETMGIPIVQGRSFEHADAASSGRVAIVNETLVNTFWKGKNPIGQRLRPCCGDRFLVYRRRGGQDVKQGGIDQKTGTEFYQFVEQFAQGPGGPETMNIAAHDAAARRAGADDGTGRARRGSHRTGCQVPGMEDVFAESIRRPRLLAQLIGGFAGLALLLAAVGTHGVLSYMVAERRREIGIRLALGADNSRVMGEIMSRVSC